MTQCSLLDNYDTFKAKSKEEEILHNYERAKFNMQLLRKNEIVD